MGVKSVGSRRQARRNGRIVGFRIADCGLRIASSNPQSAIRNPKSTAVRSQSSFARQNSRRLLRRFVDQVSHLRVRRLQIDGQLFVAEHLAGGGADRGDDDVAQAGPQFVDEAQFVGQLEQIDHLVGRGEHRDVDLAGGDSADVLLQRAAIFRQRPVVTWTASTIAPRASSPAIRLRFVTPYSCKPTTRLATGSCSSSVVSSSRQVFGSGTAMRRRDAQFAQRGQRLWAADDRFDVAHGRQKPFAIDVPLDLLHQHAACRRR